MAISKRVVKKAKAASGTPKAHTARRRPRIAVGAAGTFVLDTKQRTQKLTAVFGNNSLAHIIQVNQSQTSRWSEGSEQASVSNQQKLIDLDYIIDQLSISLYPDQIEEWLENPNPHLGGASPINVFRVNGLAALLPAIYAVANGALA